jgi:hypothetical protein
LDALVMISLPDFVCLGDNKQGWAGASIAWEVTVRHGRA